MKKIATLVGAAALLAATLVPAIAAGNSCGNSTTGPGSNNTCTVTNTSTVTVNNVNDAQINNRITTSSNTGGNSASNNTLGGSITTGNASLNTTVGSVANVNTTNVTAGFGGGAGNTGMNSVTGPFSKNTASIFNTATVGVQNDNTANVTNNVNATADTGNNKADNNTGPATIRTGSAWLSTGVSTHVNDSLTQVAIGSGAGGNTVGNSTTGPFSKNSALVTNTVDATVNNVNDLQVLNDVYVAARTGRNSASNNTLGGDITTGNATAGLGVNTEGNINTIGVAVAFGGFSNDASSNVTGPSSNNSADVFNTQNAVVNNFNNKCLSRDINRLFDGDRPAFNPDCTSLLGVFNDINATSDAGNSDANNNTGPGSVVAGWASLVQSVLTHLNDNLSQVGL